MATKVVAVFIDDLDGTAADRTVSFRIDGEDYEIDLSAANAAGLREALAPYMAAGRKARPQRRRRGPQKQVIAPDARTTSAIRDWAQRNGYSPSVRGRLPAEIIEAHDRATA